MYLDRLVGSQVISWGEENEVHRLVLDRATLTLFNRITQTGGDIKGCIVVNVALEEGLELRLDFDSGAQVRMSLRDEDYVVYEAGIIAFQDGSFDSIG